MQATFPEYSTVTGMYMVNTDVTRLYYALSEIHGNIHYDYVNTGVSIDTLYLKSLYEFLQTYMMVVQEVISTLE